MLGERKHFPYFPLIFNETQESCDADAPISLLDAQTKYGLSRTYLNQLCRKLRIPSTEIPAKKGMVRSGRVTVVAVRLPSGVGT